MNYNSLINKGEGPEGGGSGVGRKRKKEEEKEKKGRNFMKISLHFRLRFILMDHGTVLLLRIKIFTLKIGPYMMSN